MEQKEKFDFELVSPEEKLLSEPAWQVVIPGEEGHFGVRQGHMALVASVKPGVVEIWSESGAEKKRIFITGGMADVSANQCTLLAEEAVLVDSLDAGEVEQEIRTIEAHIHAADNEIDRARYEKQLVLAEAKQKALAA